MKVKNVTEKAISAKVDGVMVTVGPGKEAEVSKQVFEAYEGLEAIVAPKKKSVKKVSKKKVVKK